MNNIERCVVVSSIFLIASSASAADFSGPWVEIHGGYDRVQVDLSDYDLGKGHKDGAAYGIGAGYDFAVSGPIFLGVEVNGDLSSTQSCARDGTVRVCVKARRDLSALVRVSTQIGEKSLFYVKAGYANTRLKGTFSDSSSPSDNGSIGDNGDGIRGGLGLEFALSSKAYIKAEYDYTNYQSGFSRNQVLGGVGFRF